MLYRHHVERCNNPRDKKNFVVAKDLKILLLSLVYDAGVGLYVKPFYTSILVKWLQQRIPNSSYLRSVFVIIGDFFILETVQ